MNSDRRLPAGHIARMRMIAGLGRQDAGAPNAHAGWRSRGYVPHCDGAGLIQHIVFATAGADASRSGDYGEYWLKTPACAAIVQDALLHFDGLRYRALGWCVMPNHAHIVIEQFGGWPLATLMHSWKSFSAKQINRALARNGPVWAREYFDRFMRDDAHLNATLAYVENNPVEAGLALRAEDWRWSSARLRAQLDW